MVERFVNFFFTDFYEHCILVEDLLYLPITELSSFMFVFSLFTVICLLIGDFVVQFLFHCIPFALRWIRNRMETQSD